jgi:SAM-dependent methyltransferase
VGPCAFHGADLADSNPAPGLLDYRRVDLEEGMLPYESGSFDGVILCHVLEHLRSPLALGPEIRRVLAPGGRLYVEAPNWTSTLVPSAGFRRGQGGPLNFYDDPTHRAPWSLQGLHDFLTHHAGLEVEKLGAVRNWRRLPFDPVLLLYGFLSGSRSRVVQAVWNLSGWAIYAIGRKRG